MSPFARFSILASLLAAAFGARAAVQEPRAAARGAAMDYLVHALPKATADNPKYLTVATGVASQWLTEDVRFSETADGVVSVTMRERFSQTKDGATVWDRHQSTFSLAEVAVSEFHAPGDTTPTGEPAAGILFTCLKPGCVAALWGDKPSRADKTDIYIADAATRARILGAFRTLAE